MAVNERGAALSPHALTSQWRGYSRAPASVIPDTTTPALRKELSSTKRQIADTVADVRDTFGADFARVGDHQVVIREFVGDYLRYITWADESDYAARLNCLTSTGMHKSSSIRHSRGAPRRRAQDAPGREHVGPD